MSSVIVQLKFKKRGYLKKKKKYLIHTPCFFLGQVTCNSFRHIIMLLEGIPLLLKDLIRNMYRII